MDGGNAPRDGVEVSALSHDVGTETPGQDVFEGTCVHTLGFAGAGNALLLASCGEKKWKLARCTALAPSLEGRWEPMLSGGLEHQMVVTAASFSPEGSFLACFGNDSVGARLKLWDTKGKVVINKEPDHKLALHHDDAPRVIVVSGAGCVRANGAYTLSSERVAKRPMWRKDGHSAISIRWNEEPATDGESGAFWMIDVDHGQPALYKLPRRTEQAARR